MGHNDGAIYALLPEETMEKLLTRLARQLDALDEASLMSLWSKYATIASRFEPTQRWEEAVLVFSMIQAKRYKNQLFNYYWAQQAQPHEDGPAPAAQPLAPDFDLMQGQAEAPAPHRCRVRRQPPDSPCLFLRVVRNLRTPDTASGIANPGG